MKIDSEKGRAGIGYDLKVLKELNAEELQQVESVLIPRKDKDWRDVEALVAVNTSTHFLETLSKLIRKERIDLNILF